MQKIRINNKFFRSLSDAARFLGINKGWLSNEMKDKKAITYKDLLIEKVAVSKTIKKPKHTRTGIPVLVDGVAYKNCSEAERALGLCKCSVSDALRRGSKKVLGHTIEAVYPSMINSRHKSKVRVYNKTENKYFNSIREAALYANVDEWTMSKKMEFAGSFIDFNGNEYIRLMPMKTKNNYNNTSPKLTKIINKSKSVIIKEETCPNIIKETIKEKIIYLIKNSKEWEQINQMLEFCKLNEITIKKD